MRQDQNLSLVLNILDSRSRHHSKCWRDALSFAPRFRGRSWLGPRFPIPIHLAVLAPWPSPFPDRKSYAPPAKRHVLHILWARKYPSNRLRGLVVARI